MEENLLKRFQQEIYLVNYQISKLNAKAFNNDNNHSYKQYSQYINQISIMNQSCFDNFHQILKYNHYKQIISNFSTIISIILSKFQNNTINKKINQYQQTDKINLCSFCNQNIILANIQNNIRTMKQQLGTFHLGSLLKQYKKQIKLFSQKQDLHFFSQLQKALQSKYNNINYTQSKISQYIDEITNSIQEMEQLKNMQLHQVTQNDPIDQNFAAQIQKYFMTNFQYKIPPWVKKMFQLFKKIQKQKFLQNYHNIYSNAMIQTDQWVPSELLENRKKLKVLAQQLLMFKQKRKQLESGLQTIEKQKQHLQQVINNYTPFNKNEFKSLRLSNKIQYKSFNAGSKPIIQKVQKLNAQIRKTNHQTQISQKQQKQSLNQASQKPQSGSLILPQKISTKFKRKKGVSSIIQKSNSDFRLPKLSAGVFNNNINNNSFSLFCLERQKLNQLKSQTINKVEKLSSIQNDISQFQSQNTKQILQKIKIVQKRLSDHINAKINETISHKSENSRFKNQCLEQYNKSINNKQNNKINVIKLKKKKAQYSYLQKNNQLEDNAVEKQIKNSAQHKLQLFFKDLTKSYNLPSDLTLQSVKKIFFSIFQPKTSLDKKVISSVYKNSKKQQQRCYEQRNKSKSKSKIKKQRQKQNIKSDLQQIDKNKIIIQTANCIMLSNQALLLNSQQHLKSGKYNFIFDQIDLDLFINQKYSIKYQQSLSHNYHKKHSIHLNKKQTEFFTTLHSVFQLIKKHSKSIHNIICSFIRYPYQCIKNDFQILNIVKEMSLIAFLSYSEKILWLHRKCVKQQKNIFCSHIEKFSDKIHVLLGVIVKLEEQQRRKQSLK